MPKKPNISGYFKGSFLFDLKAGFITAVVALPLAIAFAIASGLPPVMGMYTAILAGIIGSLFGGSKFSITGPTGAMTVIILSIVHNFGLEMLLFAGLLAGIMQLALGYFKFGRAVQFIPLPIISGFTAGIGVIIFIGQIPNALGLVIPPKETAVDTLVALSEHLGAINLVALGMTFGTVIILFFLPKLTKKNNFLRNIPASLFGLVVFTSLAYFFALQVPQVGDIPSGIPLPVLPKIDFSKTVDLLPSAFTIALLGSIEALLCAVVLDGMSGTRHDSDKELMGQGLANIVMPFFGAMPATAAVARSAINFREGAKTRFAGVIHALILLLILLFFSPIAGFIPKAFLAGILMFVSVRMVNVKEFRTIVEISRAEGIVLFATFGLTVFTNLVFAVQAGMLFALVLLFVRLTNASDIKYMEEYDNRDRVFSEMISSSQRLRDSVGLYIIHGPFFFGALNVFESRLNRHMQIQKPIIVLGMEHVPFIDTSGVVRLNAFIKERHKAGGKVVLLELNPEVKKRLFKNEEFKKIMSKDLIFDDIQSALKFIDEKLIPN